VRLAAVDVDVGNQHIAMSAVKTLTAFGGCKHTIGAKEISHSVMELRKSSALPIDTLALSKVSAFGFSLVSVFQAGLQSLPKVT
jgi:hypothetical protein